MEKYVVDITDDALSDMEALHEHIAVILKAPEKTTVILILLQGHSIQRSFLMSQEVTESP